MDIVSQLFDSMPVHLRDTIARFNGHQVSKTYYNALPEDVRSHNDHYKVFRVTQLFSNDLDVIESARSHLTKKYPHHPDLLSQLMALVEPEIDDRGKAILDDRHQFCLDHGHYSPESEAARLFFSKSTGKNHG